MDAPHAWTAADAVGRLRMATDADDKYSRGVVGLRTGSMAYPGAALLGAEGAWRAGAGMVRYVGPREIGLLVLARRPETVLAEGRVQAWVIGSGTNASTRSEIETAALREILAGEVPVVVDAGALDLAAAATAPILVTPHAGEFARLRSALGLPERVARGAGAMEALRETAAVLGGTVLHKGAETLVATPGGFGASVRAGTPWLSTAGSGDVLAGIVGALVAAASADGAADVEALGPLAATAALVHGAAGRRAAGCVDETDSGHPIVAGDVADAVPRVLAELLERR